MSDFCITKEGFIKYPVSDAIFSKAEELYEKIYTDDRINDKTFCRKNKIYSTISELCCKECFPYLEEKYTYSYDLKYKSLLIDVKSKHRTVAPQLRYRGTIPAYQIEQQKCNHYMFCSTISDKLKTTVYICGIINKSSFLEKADFYKTSQVDDGGLKMQEDTYSILYKDLRRVSFA